jgi:tetratricopeptide (TPR) repeat protein
LPTTTASFQTACLRWAGKAPSLLQERFEFHHVAVLDYVFLALSAQFAQLAGARGAAERDQIFEGNRFRGNEALFEIGMNDAGSDRGLVAGADRPGAGFLLAGGQVSPQTEQIIGLFDQRAGARLFDPEPREILGTLIWRQSAKLRFDFGRDHNGASAVVPGGIVADFLNPRVRVRVAQFLFRDIAGEERGLRGEQEQSLQHRCFLRRHIKAESKFAAVQMRLQTVDQVEFSLRLFVPSFGELLLFRAPLLDAVEIRQNQFGVDDFNIPNGVHRIHHVFDIGVFKTANHLDDGVHFTDVPQELIAQTFAGARPLHEPGDIDKFKDGGYQLLRTADGGQHGQALVRDGNDSLVWLDGAKAIIGRHGLASLSDSIEESTLADVGKTYDSCTKHVVFSVSTAFQSNGVAILVHAMKARKKGQKTSPRETVTIPARGHSKLLVPGICMALAIAVLLVYVQTFHYGFVAYDDDHYVYQNPTVKAGLSQAGIAWAFTTFFYANWHPLTWVSYMLDRSLFGMDAGWFHAVNVALHIGASILLFLALHRMTRRPLRCALVAGIFALHPLHVESVAWISERKDVLSTFLEMAGLLLYSRFVESRTLGRYLALAGVFALSLMAKPMVVTFPFVLLLLDFWPLQRLQWPPRRAQWKAPLLEKIPLLVLSAIASVLTFVAQRNFGAVEGLERLPVPARLANAALGYVTYIGQAIWPVNLGVLYPGTRPNAGLAVLAAAILVAITIAALRTAGSRPYILTGWLWYVGMLLPVIGLVQVGQQSTADRYMYVPLVGLCIAVIWTAGDWVEKRPGLRSAAAIVSGVVLLASAAGAYRQAGYWQNGRTLFEHTIAVTGPNQVMRNNLGVVLAAEHDYPRATEQYRQALAINQENAEAHANLGLELLRVGKFSEARDHLQKAVRLKPTLVKGQADLGFALASLADYAGAERHLAEALRLAPGDAAVESNLCFAQLHTGQLNAAVLHCSEAIHLEPDFADAHFNLGSVLAAQGRSADARAEFAAAVRADPGLAKAQRALEEMDQKLESGGRPQK